MPQPLMPPPTIATSNGGALFSLAIAGIVLPPSIRGRQEAFAFPSNKRT